MNDRPDTSTELKSSSDKTIFSILHAAHALEDRLESSLNTVGLSMPKFSVLNELVRANEAVSLSELASRLSCVRSNMTQLVDRLESDGLVRRVDDPKDRRSVRAALTDEGRARQEAGAGEMARVYENFEAQVGPEERATLERLLTGLK
jgi:MarR family 2-MHQ and catechol resistance regulon transcriptional repressor